MIDALQRYGSFPIIFTYFISNFAVNLTDWMFVTRVAAEREALARLGLWGSAPVRPDFIRNMTFHSPDGHQFDFAINWTAMQINATPTYAAARRDFYLELTAIMGDRTIATADDRLSRAAYLIRDVASIPAGEVGMPYDREDGDGTVGAVVDAVMTYDLADGNFVQHDA